MKKFNDKMNKSLSKYGDLQKRVSLYKLNIPPNITDYVNVG